MFQRWQRRVMAALMITLPLAAGTARGQETGHAPAGKTAKKSPKPGAKAAKPGPKAAKPASRSRRQPGPGAMMSHRPPTPPPSHSHFDIPQANSLAQTPDVVLNSRVRASLMSALTAANEQDIEPQTANGVVTLTGSVKSKALRARAEQVARKVHGVRAVKNALLVK
jgi:hyperosmotically inducible periplasmic protein